MNSSWQWQPNITGCKSPWHVLGTGKTNLANLIKQFLAIFFMFWVHFDFGEQMDIAHRNWLFLHPKHLQPEGATLNKRWEVFSKCRYRACLVIDPAPVDEWSKLYAHNLRLPPAHLPCALWKSYLATRAGDQPFDLALWCFSFRHSCCFCFHICQLYFHLMTAAMLETQISE